VDELEIQYYLTKAKEFLESAKDNINKQRFNVAGFDAIQSAINANDAFTGRFVRKRGSRNHNEALKLNRDAVVLAGDSRGREFLKRCLRSRSDVGYTSILTSKSTSETIMRDAEKFLSWVETKLKDKH